MEGPRLWSSKHLKQQVNTERELVQGQTKQTPVEIEASVERGALHVFGFKLPLPIKGSGFVSLAYTDGKAVRVFRSSRGSISVQVKQTLLR